MPPLPGHIESSGVSRNRGAGYRIALMVSCFLLGLLAGETIERFIVQLPAWKHLDIRIWGEFSRHADLGNGLFVYPFEAIISLLLLATSSIILIVKKEIPSHIAWPTYVATIFSAIGIISTFFAAPVMLHVKTIGDDPVALQLAFDKFYYWSFFRGIAQTLSFIFCILAVGRNFGK
jgi:hypothetical protein